MTRSLTALAAALGAALILAGCSGGVSGLTTGAIAGTPKPVDTNTPSERALQTAAVSARAEKCGYNFDPNKLRASYLAYEAGQGVPPQQLPAVEKLYDVTRRTVFDRIRTDDAYCDDARTNTIKTELTRHLAGDFAVAQKAAAKGDAGGWFSQPAGREVFNPDWINNPKWESKTKRVE
jgi:hypothetical protein